MFARAGIRVLCTQVLIHMRILKLLGRDSYNRVPGLSFTLPIHSHRILDIRLGFAFLQYHITIHCRRADGQETTVTVTVTKQTCRQKGMGSCSSNRLAVFARYVIASWHWCYSLALHAVLVWIHTCTIPGKQWSASDYKQAYHADGKFQIGPEPQ